MVVLYDLALTGVALWLVRCRASRENMRRGWGKLWKR